MASHSIARIDVAGRIRIGLRLAGLVLALIACVAAHGLWRLFRLPSPWPRWFLGGAARICGVRRHDVGRAMRRDVIFLANHTSWLDILVLAGGTGTAFVAKAELQGVSLIGWLCTLNHTIFVARTDRMGIAAQIADLHDALAQAWPVTIFPEGTTSGADELLAFKASLLAVLEPPPPGVMVQPVLLDYGTGARAVEWLGDETGQANALRILARRGSFAVRVAYLPPFDPADHAGRKGIAAEARRRIAEAMGLPASDD
ncbi:lyso-ornithine lipid acyltransferase [Hephaestia caeni]|uniref:Lyso-ornithine lipid acyltransferase n=1 Tax=Hephaestia caeni TaxID=645617 RepID=A0A397NPS8_9SPHN|nr:lysophospholipid acyltransferase family protein [Hephaestia caeni]RIA37197.1 lyso-ornithine lipid acyltransferase [Hephaestia caeni]